MNVLQYSDTLNSTQDIQIWNNVVFDNVGSEDATVKVSWSSSSMNPMFTSRSESFDSNSSKENHIPLGTGVPSIMANSNSKISVPMKPLQSNNATLNSQLVSKNASQKRDIDAEIEEIEKKIRRLQSRLESLRLEKLAQSIKITETRGKFVPAKFMEPKQKKTHEESLSVSSSKTKVINRRGVSLGPAEIFASASTNAKFRQSGKPEITPLQPMQNRRKSCFWKLQDIDEVKSTRPRGKSVSVSPKSRKMVSRNEVSSKQAMTTVGSKRAVKKEDGIVSAIQPMRLFKDGEKSVPAKKTVKPGRTVASRYNQAAGQSNGDSACLKRSLPDISKDDRMRSEKRRASAVEKSGGTEGRTKKKWEVPSKIVVYNENQGEEKDEFSLYVKMGDAVPRIRIDRCAGKTPRDSGQAKRVAELMGRKSYFCSDEEAGSSVCQALSFAED